MKASVTFLEAGSCTHPAFMVGKPGGFRSCRFPAMVGLIQHPELGSILFDTGYTDRFHASTRQWPNKLYACITPVEVGVPLKTQLNQKGIAPESIRWIVLSHFHADHIAGLKDFPNARLIGDEAGLKAIRARTGLRAVIQGYLPELLPNDIEDWFIPISHFPAVTLPSDFSPFTEAYALIDKQLWLVPLPGHAAGHIGLLIRLNGPNALFMVGDACWVSEQVTQLRMPHPLTRLFMRNFRAYQKTIVRLHQLQQRNPHVRIIPAHCQQTHAKIQGKTYDFTVG